MNYAQVNKAPSSNILKTKIDSSAIFIKGASRGTKTTIVNWLE